MVGKANFDFKEDFDADAEEDDVDNIEESDGDDFEQETGWMFNRLKFSPKFPHGEITKKGWWIIFFYILILSYNFNNSSIICSISYIIYIPKFLIVIKQLPQ